MSSSGPPALTFFSIINSFKMKLYVAEAVNL